MTWRRECRGHRLQRRRSVRHLPVGAASTTSVLQRVLPRRLLRPDVIRRLDGVSHQRRPEDWCGSRAGKLVAQPGVVIQQQRADPGFTNFNLDGEAVAVAEVRVQDEGTRWFVIARENADGAGRTSPRVPACGEFRTTLDAFIAWARTSTTAGRVCSEHRRSATRRTPPSSPHARRSSAEWPTRCCGDWHRAEDLLQTALVKLYVAWPRLHRDGREEAYARQIIVRANIDEHRRAWHARAGHRRAAGSGCARSSTSYEDRDELDHRPAAAPSDAAQRGGPSSLARSVGARHSGRAGHRRGQREEPHRARPRTTVGAELPGERAET